MKRRSIAGVAGLIAFYCLPAFAMELTDRQVERLVRTSGILSPKYSANSSTVSGHEVIVKVTKAPGETERDCRINSILLAKTIMHEDSTIDVVSVWFHATTEQWWVFQPNRATVDAYGTGQISAEKLLQMLPRTVRTEARTVNALLNQSVGAGPEQYERLNLLLWIKAHSGSDPNYAPLPTIDYYLPRFREIEKDALSESNLKTDPELSKKIIALKTELVNAAIAFNAKPARDRDREIDGYMRSHGFKKASGAATQQVARASASTSGSAQSVPGAVVLTAQQFGVLCQKYPDLTPDRTSSFELVRRQQVGLRLMQLSEAGQLRREWSEMFKSVEQAAKSNDNSTAQIRLRALETMLRMPSLPLSGK